MLRSYFEMFIQNARPFLLVAKTPNGKTFEPNTVWVNENGSTMSLTDVTKEIRKLSQRFNPHPNITPLQFRRMTITKVFSGKVVKDLELETFTSHLADYLNVEEKVMKDYYDRFSVLDQDVQVQKVLQASQFPGLDKELLEVEKLNKPLLQGNAITDLVPAVGRPVRTELDDKAWSRSLRKQLGKRAEFEKASEDAEEAASSPKRRRVLLSSSSSTVAQEWEVKKILGKKIVDDALFYRVKWRGWKKPTWEPLTNLANALQTVSDYECSL